MTSWSVVVAAGSADEIKSKVGGERLELVATDDSDVGTIAATICDLGSDRPVVDGQPHLPS